MLSYTLIITKDLLDSREFPCKYTQSSTLPIILPFSSTSKSMTRQPWKGPWYCTWTGTAMALISEMAHGSKLWRQCFLPWDVLFLRRIHNDGRKRAWRAGWSFSSNMVTWLLACGSLKNRAHLFSVGSHIEREDRAIFSRFLLWSDFIYKWAKIVKFYAS